MPVSLCAVGKVLIARLHDHDIEAMFPDDAELPVLTPKSIRTGAELKAQLREIRRQGYAFEDEESTTGVVCLAVSVPTHGAHGPSLGLSVTALKATYSAEQGAQMVKELKELARSLGNPMG
jgi:DNA-binding IclR family transcriptional regulator